VAAVNWYPNGAGGSTGDDFVILTKLYTPGTIWYVNYSTGVDAAAPAGKRREKPLKTTGQALTNASAGDIICWLSGHNETVSTVVTVSKAGLIFASEGSGSSRARLTCGAATEVFDVTAAGVWICNVYFPASTVAPVARVRTAAARTVLRGCYFECGTLDTTDAVKLITGSGTASIRNTSFVSTSTNTSLQPATAIEFANAVSDVEMDNVVIDGGASGWSSSAILGTAAVTRLEATNIDLLNDSVATLATTSTGHLFVRNSSGNSEVIWTP
jgi:hypothetical protein